MNVDKTFNTESNYSATEFAEYLSVQSKPTPNADAFGDRKDLGIGDYSAENQHEIQKKHIISWFELKGNESAKKVYNQLRDPAMRLWIAERIGIDEKAVEMARNEAGGAYMSDDFADKCSKKGSSLTSHQAKIIRQHIPWDAIFDIWSS